MTPPRSLSSTTTAKAGSYNGGHDVHMGLLKKEANGERNGEAPLILLHAEDQMAGTETMRVMATELIEVHKQLQALKA